MACVAGENRDSEIKVFCFFSSEKKAFCLLLLSQRLPCSRRQGHLKDGISQRIRRRSEQGDELGDLTGAQDRYMELVRPIEGHAVFNLIANNGDGTVSARKLLLPKFREILKQNARRRRRRAGKAQKHASPRQLYFKLMFRAQISGEVRLDSVSEKIRLAYRSLPRCGQRLWPFQRITAPPLQHRATDIFDRQAADEENGKDGEARHI